MEAFATVQGEGAHAGRAAYFIRLGGCDVGCVWCDVKESWKEEGWPLPTVEELAGQAADFPMRLAVVTGGEPLMHNLDSLTAALKSQGFATHIETSGAHPMSGDWDWVTLSPKKFKAALPQAYERADELKVIVFHKSDLAWAEKEAERVGERCLLYLQPEWDRREEATGWILDHVARHPRWRISLQTHKYLGIP